MQTKKSKEKVGRGNRNKPFAKGKKRTTSPGGRHRIREIFHDSRKRIWKRKEKVSTCPQKQSEGNRGSMRPSGLQNCGATGRCHCKGGGSEGSMLEKVTGEGPLFGKRRCSGWGHNAGKEARPHFGPGNTLYKGRGTISSISHEARPMKRSTAPDMKKTDLATRKDPYEGPQLKRAPKAGSLKRACPQSCEEGRCIRGKGLQHRKL